MAQKTPLPALTVMYADRWNSTWFVDLENFRTQLMQDYHLRFLLTGFLRLKKQWLYLLSIHKSGGFYFFQVITLNSFSAVKYKPLLEPKDENKQKLVNINFLLKRNKLFNNSDLNILKRQPVPHWKKRISYKKALLWATLNNKSVILKNGYYSSYSSYSSRDKNKSVKSNNNFTSWQNWLKLNRNKIALTYYNPSLVKFFYKPKTSFNLLSNNKRKLNINSNNMKSNCTVNVTATTTGKRKFSTSARNPGGILDILLKDIVQAHKEHEAATLQAIKQLEACLPAVKDVIPHKHQELFLGGVQLMKDKWQEDLRVANYMARYARVRVQGHKDNEFLEPHDEEALQLFIASLQKILKDQKVVLEKILADKKIQEDGLRTILPAHKYQELVEPTTQNRKYPPSFLTAVLSCFQSIYGAFDVFKGRSTNNTGKGPTGKRNFSTASKKPGDYSPASILEDMSKEDVDLLDKKPKNFVEGIVQSIVEEHKVQGYVIRTGYTELEDYFRVYLQLCRDSEVAALQAHKDNEASFRLFLKEHNYSGPFVARTQRLSVGDLQEYLEKQKVYLGYLLKGNNERREFFLRSLDKASKKPKTTDTPTPKTSSQPNSTTNNKGNGPTDKRTFSTLAGGSTNLVKVNKQNNLLLKNLYKKKVLTKNLAYRLPNSIIKKHLSFYKMIYYTASYFYKRMFRYKKFPTIKLGYRALYKKFGHRLKYTHLLRRLGNSMLFICRALDRVTAMHNKVYYLPMIWAKDNYKFLKRAVVFERYIYQKSFVPSLALLHLAMSRGAANLIIDLLVRKLRRAFMHAPFLSAVEHICRFFMAPYEGNTAFNNSLCKGMDLIFKGKINGSDRSKTWRFKFGPVHTATFYTNTREQVAKCVTRYGVFNIRVRLKLGAIVND